MKYLKYLKSESGQLIASLLLMVIALIVGIQFLYLIAAGIMVTRLYDWIVKQIEDNYEDNNTSQ